MFQFENLTPMHLHVKNHCTGFYFYVRVLGTIMSKSEL